MDYGGCTREEIAEILAWDWAETRNGEVLHHVAEIHRPDSGGRVAVGGTTSCGYRGTLAVPGLLMRMGAERCRRCCDRLGWPHGTGSPKNDPTLRPLVEAQIARPEES